MSEMLGTGLDDYYQDEGETGGRVIITAKKGIYAKEKSFLSLEGNLTLDTSPCGDFWGVWGGGGWFLPPLLKLGRV